MSRFKKSRLSKVISVTLGLTTAVMMFGGVLIAPASAATVEELQVQIATLLSQISALQTQMSGVTGGSVATGAVCGYTFGANLKQGQTGSDVMNLQKVLNSDSATQIASSGVGSAGNESSYFGSLTKSAVIKFQNKYSAEILGNVGLTAGTGYVGPSTRAKLNALFGTCGTPTTPTTPPTGGTTPPVSTGTGLTVSAVAQPQASLAVESAARLPFTKVALTASADGDITVNSILVERTGLAQDAVFSGIVLLDENGNQVGIAKTLNSVHQATVGDPFVVKAGQTRTVTIAGNMAAVLDAYSGQVAFLSVVKVNTSANVSGALPITGAGHTTNISLVIGSVTMATGSLNPSAVASKEVGTTGYTFTSVKVTAGSAEKIRLNSIRWNQTGSVGSTDLANLKTYVDGTAYDVVASSNGQYYTTNFGSGIVIDKGAYKEISIKGDIANGSGRTIAFDIYKNTDVNVTGETFGYGLSAPTDGSTGVFGSTSPWYDAYVVTVTGGGLDVQKATSIGAQNIVENVTDQSLGGFLVEAKGEDISVASLVFNLGVSSAVANAQDITNITLVDENGNAVAGPVDASGGKATFTDSVTFKVGKHVYQLKGKAGTDFVNGNTITASTTPSTDWTTVVGQSTSNTITPTPASVITANAMTLKSGALTVTPATSLVAQNIVDDSVNVVFGRYVLDATNSGEDVRVTTAQIQIITGTNADIDELNSLQLYDGTTSLTTGDIENPSGNTGGADANLTFTIDSNALTVVKGTQKIIELRGSVNASSTPTANTTFKSDFSAGSPAWTVTGASTGQDVVETLNTTAGAVLTVVGAGTLTATLDSSSPVEKWNVSDNEATIGVFHFKAVNEDMAVTDLALAITTASSSASDIQTLSLYNGTTLVKSLTSPAFTSGVEAITFNSSGSESFIVPKGDNGANLTVKAKFAKIGTGFSGTSGNLLKIATSTTATQNKALGVQSNTAVNILGSAANSSGARYFKSLPTVAKLGLSSNALGNGVKSLYKFKVTADTAGDIDLYKFSFTIATSSANADSFQLIETDTGKTVASSVQSLLTAVNVVVATAQYGSTLITIPAGQSRTYELKATITNAGTSGDSVQVTLDGDAAHLAATTNGLGAADVDADTDDNFIWSDRSNSSHTILTTDFYNGYKVPGLPTTGLDTEVVSQ